MEVRIREVRKRAGLTQTEFGERIGVRGNTVTGYETGIRTPSNHMIYTIAQTFHVREEWLRTGEGEMYQETAETIFDQLAAEYDLGPAGKMIVQAALKMYRIGGEKAFVDLVRDILPMMQDIVKEADADILSRALAAQEEEQERSGTE